MSKTYTVDIQALRDQAERKGIHSAEELSEKSGINKEVLLPILEGRKMCIRDSHKYDAYVTACGPCGLKCHGSPASLAALRSRLAGRVD